MDLILLLMGLQVVVALLRAAMGNGLRGAKSINVSSIIAAELWALREGLIICMEMHLQDVEVELDASTAISLVSRKFSSNRDLSGLVANCRELLL